MAKSKIKVENYKQALEDAWLGIYVDPDQLYNPLAEIPPEYSEQPEMFFMDMMARPEYFSLLVTEILNLTCPPMQYVILSELWKRKFPMLIGSRGLSKTFCLALYCLMRAFLMPGRRILVTGSGFRQSKLVFQYMEQIWSNAPIFRDMCQSAGLRRETDRWRFYVGESIITGLPVGCLTGDTLLTTDRGIEYLEDLRVEPKSVWSNGEYRDIGFFFDSGITPVRHIKTEAGFEFTGTHNHKMKIVENNEVIWKRSDEIKIGDRILIDKTDRDIPSSENIDLDNAYALGCMIGDGSWINPYFLHFTTVDPNHFIPSLNIIGNFTYSKENHYQCFGKQIRTEWLKYWDLEKAYCYDKIIPSKLLRGGKKAIAACLQGLFDTDGYVSSSYAKGGLSKRVGYTTTSIQLAKQLHYILLHFGIVSTLRTRQPRICNLSGNMSQISYELIIFGEGVDKFHEHIGFRLPRKRERLEAIIKDSKRHYGIVNCGVPIDRNILGKFLKTNKLGSKFSYAHMMRAKSISANYINSLIDYCRTKNIVVPDNISKFGNTNIYYDTVKSVEDSVNQQTYDINVPYGNEYCANGFFSHNTGEKIRGERANDLIVDEFASIVQEIFEVVMAGFTAVAANPIQNMQRVAKAKLAESLGITLMDESEDYFKSNQIIISGTAFYSFNHFCKYWEDWKQIVETKGDEKKIREYFAKKSGKLPEDVTIDPNFKWTDYSVIRIPYELIPPGMMDAGQIARAKATIHSSLYNMEYGAVFPKDSEGFFRRSLIETCVASPSNNIIKSDGPVVYNAKLRGNINGRYVYGIDPASEIDNLSIVIIERHNDHNRIVYVWTTNKRDHRNRVRAGHIQEDDFYAYCALKIRELMKVFPPEVIGVDSQGGGFSIREALGRSALLQPGEQRILEIIDPTKAKPTDGEAGLHILQMIDFASKDFTGPANHGMRQDFEKKNLLFPNFDAVEIGIAELLDKTGEVKYDSLEDCIMEIEELKNELASIVVSLTPSGREHWDVPEVKIAGQKKGYMRKDRYSGLLIANFIARALMDATTREFNFTTGGWAGRFDKGDKNHVPTGNLYTGPEVLVNKLKGLY